MPRLRSGASLFVLFAVSACVTPMGPAEVERYTTCTGTTLEQIRKNLLLAGYEIEEQGKEDLVTDWRQVGGFGNDKTLRKITVVQIGEGTFRFRVRGRHVTVTQENQATLTTVEKDRRGKVGTSTSVSFGREVERVSDFDQSYYKEYADDYEQTRREVCGR